LAGTVAVQPVVREPHAPRPWVLWLIVLAGAALVVISFVLAFASDDLDRPGLRTFLVGWITVPYIVSGILAWWRRPVSRLGPLMLATGFVMAQTPLQWTQQPVLHSVGHLLDMLPAAMFLHVFLSFPTGRLLRKPERFLVVCCYAAAAVLQLVKVMLGADPTSLLALRVNPAAADAVEQFQLSLISALLLLGGVLLFVRRRQAGKPRRRPAALLVDAFGLALVMLALLYLAGMRGWAVFETIRLVTFAALGLAPVAFLFALLDARLARGDAAALLVELSSNPTMDLQAPLARAVRDPSLTLAYWLPQFNSWADQGGQPVSLQAADPRRALRFIDRDGEPMAALLFDQSLEDERELVDAVTAAAGIALENGQLRAELRARLQEVEGSRVRVLEAGRKERQRLERDLHDGAQQRLVALSLELGLLGENERADAEIRERLLRARQEVAESLEELRDVARGIYPAVLSGHGLPVALESLAARASVPVELHVDLEQRLPESVEVAAYYVVSESLTNIGKHARARSAIVQIAQSADTVVVEVSDNGVGGADSSLGSGLRGLRDRVDALGGRLQVETPIGGGTKILAEIPCQ
jgi:signal transduction histidine kinase